MNSSKTSHLRHWLGILGLFAASVFAVNQQYDSHLQKASVLNLPSAAPFDGTVYPLPVGMDWTHFKTEDYKKTFEELDSSLFTDFPECAEDDLTFPSSDLVWGNAEHNRIRNVKITCSVPWAGSYEMDDSGRGAGSHPAWDIKTLAGTPVLSIANGVVIESGFSSSGWGNHVVIMHKDVPTPGNPSVKTTLYSSYSHLDEILTTEGSVVNKGDLIGKVGMTGTATTNHLHFQLDTEEAPYLPSWPFTSKQASDAGYTFWEAVSAGLNQENVYAWTYDGLQWVEENLDGDFSPSDAIEEANESSEEEEEEQAVETTPTTPEETLSTLDHFELETDGSFGSATEILTVKAFDAQNRLLSSFTGEPAELKVTRGEATLFKDGRPIRELDPEDFDSGVAQIELQPNDLEPITVKLAYDGQELIAELSPQLFSDLSETHPYYKAVSYLYNNGTVAGYPDGSFKPDQTVSRVEALKFIFKGMDQDFGSNGEDLPFQDVSLNRWYSPYLIAAFSRQIVQGYPDGNFRPEQGVNRVEFLKILTSTLEIDLDQNVGQNPYSDVNRSDWFAPYVEFAKENDLFPITGKNFEPAKPMSRVEVAEVIYRAIQKL